MTSHPRHQSVTEAQTDITEADPMTDLQVSNCCRDGLIVRGDATQRWTCRNCGKPCGTMTNPAAPEFLPLLDLATDEPAA